MDKEFLNTVVDKYKKYLGQKLVSIILFGSQARGEAKEGSDYDIFIIASDLPKNALERSRFIHKPMYESGLLSLSILAKTPEEFQKDVASLYLDLCLDGIILFDNDFVEPKLLKLKEIIHSSGLRRVKDDGEYHWEWDKYPKGEWEITWEGFREF